MFCFVFVLFCFSCFIFLFFLVLFYFPLFSILIHHFCFIIFHPTFLSHHTTPLLASSSILKPTVQRQQAGQLPRPGEGACADEVHAYMRVFRAQPAGSGPHVPQEDDADAAVAGADRRHSRQERIARCCDVRG